MTRISLRQVVILVAASGALMAQAPARDAFGQAEQPANRPPAAQAVRPAYGVPAQVTLKPGTFVNVRINQELASNHNQPGDGFSGTLIQPVVVDGVVLAQRGQAVYGRVSQAEKVKGVSHLGIELTGLTLADGSQVQVRTQLVSRQGGRMSGGEQAGIIATTTAVGAVVGASSDYHAGTGAAIGGGAGAAAGLIGVLLTRNHPSVIYPETALTFQTESALTVNTGAVPGAFRFVGPDDYNHSVTQVVQSAPVQRRTYIYGPGYYDPYYYPYWGFGGPRIFFGGGYRFGGGFRGRR